jgi:predicted amidohydrolase
MKKHFLACLMLSWCLVSNGQTLRVACAQINYGPDCDQNVTGIISVINQAADSGADLVLTPEAMMTDYKNGVAIAQSWVDGKLALIAQACSTRSIGALVSGNRVSGDSVFICAYLLDKKGRRIGFYDKTGLLSDETGAGFTKGMEYPVFDFDNNGSTVKVGIQICRDQQYFAGFRFLAMKGAKVILHIAAAISNPELPAEIRLIHAKLRSRALTNSVFVASANKAGDYQLLRSHIWDPTGRVLAEAVSSGPVLLCADQDLGLADHKNLNLRRSDLYELIEK